MKTDYRTVPVEEVLPHSGDMVLLDEVLDYGDDFAVSSVTVTPQSRFFEPALGGIHASIGIEWMAQTIAAMAGIHSLQNNRPVQVGFLLGTRRYQPDKTVFETGSQYRVSVRQLYHEDNGLGAFNCMFDQYGNTIVEAMLNVFAPDDAETFLKGEGV